MTEGKAGVRLKMLAFLVLAMFAALTTRLWFLQVLAAEQYKQDAANNSVRLVEIPAQRGRILDSAGEELVSNRLSLVLTINRQEVGEAEEEILYRLSQLLDVPAAELGARLDDPRYFSFSPIPVAIDVPYKVVAYVREHPRDFRGVDVLELPVRSYPLGTAAAHILGYLGQVSQEKLDSPEFADYRAGDLVGVAGVEAVYEQELVGTSGLEKFQVNSLGENLRQLGRQEPVPGNDVHLTLDADTQRLAEESLRIGMQHARTVFDEFSQKHLLADAGAVIVMDPDDGGIEAMASLPGFNPGLFTRSMSRHEYQRRFGEGKGSPLVNRAIAGQYPAGSTYKPFIALSGLQRGRSSMTQTYGCPGTWIAPFNEDDPNAIQYGFDNWTPANLGFMSLSRALAVSCDTIFYPLGYSYWDDYFINSDEAARDVESKELLQQDLETLGFGSLTNVDLPGEEEARVPTSAWKQEFHERNPQAFPEGEWFPGDLILMSIGQGDTLVTPLQLAAAYATLMNDGRECTPHLLARVVDPASGEEVRRYRPNCRPVRAFDPAFVSYVREALEGTVRGDGTAAGAFAGFPFTQVSVAGKTGTAEVKGIPPKQDFSWFAAMVEAQGERHVVVVLVEQGGHGSTTAAPIARRIIEGMFGLEYSSVGLGDAGIVTGTD
ncbi:MAG: penicillin-binding protein 2 [Actinomycetota bacterium]